MEEILHKEDIGQPGRGLDCGQYADVGDDEPRRVEIDTARTEYVNRPDGERSGGRSCES